MEENSLLKKNLSFAQDSREGEEKFVEGKIRRIEELMANKLIKTPSSYRRNEWKSKV